MKLNNNETEILSLKRIEKILNEYSKYNPLTNKVFIHSAMHDLKKEERYLLLAYEALKTCELLTEKIIKLCEKK